MSNCNQCLPAITVGCISGDEKILLNIGGLTEGGSYYVRITTQSGNKYIIPFTFNAGVPVEIGVADLPEGFFSKDRVVLLEIVEDPSFPALPFQFTTHVTGIDLTISCNQYYSTEIGETA